MHLAKVIFMLKHSVKLCRYVHVPVPEKVATTCTEDGHKQTTKTSTTI